MIKHSKKSSKWILFYTILNFDFSFLDSKFKSAWKSRKIWKTCVTSKILYFFSRSINPYPWILKKPKTRDYHHACFVEKKSRAQHWENFCICFCALNSIFQKTRSARVPKMAYIFVQFGIFPLILAYAIWKSHHSIAQLTLYLYI